MESIQQSLSGKGRGEEKLKCPYGGTLLEVATRVGKKVLLL